MKLFAWLLGPLSFREQLALPARGAASTLRFLGWLFGRIDVDDRSPANYELAVPAKPPEPRPAATPPRFCVVLHHARSGKLIGVGGADLPDWVTAVLEANYFNAGCTLPIVASPAVLTRALRRHRGELNKVQILTTIEVIEKIKGQATESQAAGKATDDLPHGAPPDAAMPTGYEPPAASPAVWPHKKRRAS